MAGKGDPRQDSVLTSGATQVVGTDQFAVNSADLLVKFCKAGVQPPSLQYITLDDFIGVVAYNPNTTTVLNLNVRILTPAGIVVPMQFQVVSQATWNQFPRQFQLPEGFILSAVLVPQVAVPGFGWCYAQIGLMRNQALLPQTFAILTAGYASQMAPLYFPGGGFRSPSDGRGNIRNTAGNAPAAGADFNITVPATRRWKIMSLVATLTTSAAVANRQVQLKLNDSVNDYYFTSQGPAQAAALVWKYTFAPIGYAPVNTNNTVQIHYDSTQEIQPTATISSVTANLQAGDQWSTQPLEILEWADEA